MQNKTGITVLAIGDLVGEPGLALVKKWLPFLREKYAPDLVIVNGENSAENGRGINREVFMALRGAGVDVVTSGNHIWGQRESYNLIATQDRLLRPINFPSSCPGRGVAIVPLPNGQEAAVINVQGRVFMHEQLGCPFQAIESALSYVKTRAKYIIVDFHAETTSEKAGLGFFLDGQVSLVFGTHTHVQTADERILPKGTAFISDLGCCAAQNSMLGMNTESVLSRMITQMPSKFAVEKKGPFVLNGIIAELDGTTGLARSISRISLCDDQLVL